MGLFGMSTQSLKSAATDFVAQNFREGLAHTVPMLTPLADQVRRIPQWAHKNKINRLHKLRDKTEENTVSNAEYELAKKLVNSYWTANPLVKLWRYFTKLMFGSSREKEHISEDLKEMDGLASMYEAGNFANDAVAFFRDRTNKLIKQLSKKGGLIRRLFFKSKNKLENSELLKAYVSSLCSWIKALDNNTGRDTMILVGYRDELYYLYESGESPLSEAMRTQIAEAFNSRLPEDEQIDSKNYKSPPSFYDYFDNNQQEATPMRKAS